MARRSKPVTCDGVDYASAGEFAIEINRSHQFVYDKLAQGWTPEEIKAHKARAYKRGKLKPKRDEFKPKVYPLLENATPERLMVTAMRWA